MFVLLEYCTNVEKSMHRSIPIHPAPPEEEANVSELPARGSDPLPLGGQNGCGRRLSAPKGKRAGEVMSSGGAPL